MLRLEPAFRWLDDRQLIYVAVRDSDQALPRSDYGRTTVQARAVWDKTLRGEATASAIRSDQFDFAERRLLVLDAQTGEKRSAITTTERKGISSARTVVRFVSH